MGQSKTKHNNKIHEKDYTDQNRSERTQTNPSGSIFSSPIKLFAVGIGILLIVLAIVTLTFGGMMGSPMQGTLRSAASSQNNINAGGSNADLGGTLAPVVDGVQQVQLSMQGYQYMPDPIRVKVGVPVKMVADLNTVTGCMRSIQIPELGVASRVSESNNVIEFTPSKAGVFKMTCSMGMGRGTVIVEDENGNAPAAANTPSPLPTFGAGSCGSSGGCGCHG